MSTPNYKRTKFACYFAYVAGASVFCLPPLLFATFHELYGISYTLLGTLVLINFCTQLGIDLIFSFFSKFFNIRRTICLMPLLTSLGLAIYSLIPMILPQYAYIGLVIGTVIFSVASGLGEVLLSPTIAALPSDTPDKDMSVLHSLYGYGFVGVTLISTICLQIIKQEYWGYLVLFWAILPILSSILFISSPIPDMKSEQIKSGQVSSRYRTGGLVLCMMCIFLGACAENTMSSWISSYAENALNLPKIWGDIFGMCLFAMLLAITRTLYAKYGKNIFNTLCASMIGSVFCYILVALSPNSIISLLACVALGICTAMLWPGTLIFMEERVPMVGVAAYALMAAGGDFGASLAPQAFGIIIDKISITEWANNLGTRLSVSSEEIGFKVGMLLIALAPLLGILLLLYMKKYFKIKRNK